MDPGGGTGRDAGLRRNRGCGQQSCYSSTWHGKLFKSGGPRASNSKSGEASAPAAATKPDAAAKPDSTAKPESSSLEMELQQLRDMIQAQTEELEQQRAALREQQKKMDALQAQIHAAPAAVSSSITPYAPSPTAVFPNAGTAPVITTTSGAVAGPADPQAKPEEPTSIHIKGITLTPGGFFAAEKVFGGRKAAATAEHPPNTIPFQGSSQASVE